MPTYGRSGRATKVHQSTDEVRGSARNLADMRSHDAPALRQAHPGLRLASALTVALKLGTGVGVVAAKTGELRARNRAARRARCTRHAKSHNRCVTITVFRDPHAQHPRILPEQTVQRGDIVMGKRVFVGFEQRAYFG